MLKQKDNENKLKRIWQIVAFENNYDSYSSYVRDMKRYVIYTVIMLVLFILGVYFTVERLSAFCYFGGILLLHTNFSSRNCYREFAPRVWKVRRTIKLQEECPVILDKKLNNIIFYEEKYYDLGDSLTQAESVKEGFVVSKLSLENEVFFDKSEEKNNCIVLETVKYEDERFETKFSKRTVTREAKLGESVSRCRYIVYTDNLKEALG